MGNENLKNNKISKIQYGIYVESISDEKSTLYNLPLLTDKVKKVHTFDRGSMATAFPFTMSEVGHLSGIPLGFNKQTGAPILFDNFHDSLTNYNMVVFAKSGARKICYNENINF